MSKLEIEGIGVGECGVGGEVRLYRRPSVCPSRARPAQSSIDRPCKVERTGHSRLRLARVAGVSHWLPRRFLPSHWLSLLGVGLRGCTRGSGSLLFLALRRWLVGADTAMPMSWLSYFAHSEGWLEWLERLSYFLPSGSAVVQCRSGDAHAHGGLHGGLR